MFVVISYDIPDDRRRLKVAQVLLNFGGQRVQRSVFEVHIAARDLERLQAKLRKVHGADEDSIRFYFLCESCKPKTVLLGVAQPSEEPGLLII